MKKYLIIGDGNSPHILKWIKELDKHFEVYHISSTGVMKEICSILPDERIFAFKLNISDSSGNLAFVRMLFPLKRIINRIRPDFVNAHYVTSNGFLAALVRKFSGRKFPLIITAWGTDIMVTPGKNRFYRSLTRFSLRQASLVTTDSKHAAELVSGFCDTPVITFPFGLDELPAVSFQDKDPSLFFSNRTLNANSNIDKVLEFFSRIRQNEPNARLVIGNDGPKRSELEELSARLGLEQCVRFVGFLSSEEQDKLYRRAMFYFSILTSDALSVSLLEAMAHGCIPIVSDLPDNVEWVHKGLNGLILSSSTDPDELLALRKKAEDIFDHNRRMVTEGAIFPDAIEQFAGSLFNV